MKSPKQIQAPCDKCYEKTLSKIKQKREMYAESKKKIEKRLSMS